VGLYLKNFTESPIPFPAG